MSVRVALAFRRNLVCAASTVRAARSSSTFPASFIRISTKKQGTPPMVASRLVSTI
jgi:hypothetical protein